MALLSLMIITYLAGGLFVILDLYQKQVGDSLILSQWHTERPNLYRLKMHAMRITASLVIILVWPVFLAAEWSAHKRYRMASFIDDDHF
jgi:hypothetical protein